MPWGISESAYAFTDRAGNYQYRAFGVPGLGLKRGLADELVVAPYATALASLVDPAAAAENFERLARAGLDGRFGFYEAIDYRPRAPRRRRAPADAVAGPSSCAPSSRTTRACRSWRSPTSSATTCFVARFHADPRVQATELLLQERVPREAILSEPRPAESATARAVAPGVRVAAVPVAAHGEPAHALPVERPLHGRAHARRRRLQHVARPRGHPAARRSDLRRRRALHLPARSRGRAASGRRPISRSASEPDELRGDVRPRQGRRSAAATATSRRSSQVTVSPEDDVEVRRLSITNRGDRPREIEVTSYAEIVLARPEDDLAHPAFGKLFIETEFDRAERRPAVQPAAARAPTRRRPGRSTCSASRAGSAAPSSGRPIARASSAAAARRPIPLALDGRALSGTTGAVLDPDRGAARARAPGAGRVRARDVRHRRRARSRRPRSRWRASTATAAPRRARSRWRSRTCTSRCSTWGSATIRPSSSIGWRRASSASDASCISPADLAAQHARAVEPLGLRHLRRSADRARARHRGRRRSRSSRQLLHAQEYWRVKGLRADVVILNEHPAEYLDETQDFLDRARAGAALGGLERQAGRHVPAARRRHARSRSPSARAPSRASCCAAISASSRRSSIGRRRGCTRRATCRRRRTLAPPEPAADAACRCRRSSWTTASAASRPTAASTSSCSTAIARRRCRGRTCWPTRSSARWSARRGRRSPGPRTAARTG